MLIAVLLGWEFLTLVMDPRRFPTLSSVTEYFWHFRGFQVAAYALWVWLGWDIMFDRTEGPARWLRRPLHNTWGRWLLIGGIVAFGWWATALPHTVVRWTGLAVPGAFLVAAAWGVRHRADDPSVWFARSRRWARRNLLKDRA